MKKYSTSTTLVIVESPAKCKKIESYLGPGYKCLASFGHLRELVSLNNIDIPNGWLAKYTIIDNALKQKQIALLRNEIAAAGQVILATDDDREGEAIAWHICQLFGLSVEKTKRILFHEITEKAIQEAVAHPTHINMNTVNAQQTRQMLDLLVGFRISPLLWKYISRNTEKSLSAGRCQTPALKLIYENEQDMKRSPGRKAYNTTGYFNISGTIMSFDLNRHHEQEEEMTDFLDVSIDFQYAVVCEEPKKIYKQPPSPLTTSRIQQLASNDLHISPKETMKLCQTLYEAGYITYMRTDSQNYSEEFKESTKRYILGNYDATYLSQEMFKDKTLEVSNSVTNTKTKPKTKSRAVPTEEKSETVAAHEAIRPTNISLRELPSKMEPKEIRMYNLIWMTTMSSCMAPAEFFSLKATIQVADTQSSGKESLYYSCTSEYMTFAGWLILTSAHCLGTAFNKTYQIFSALKPHTPLPIKCTKILSKSVMREAKQHYTEAKLVNLLEDCGIGRPSTFSSLIDKIQERGYVKKQDVTGKIVECKDYEMVDGEIFETEVQREFGAEKNKLVIQPIGILVLEFLEKHFSSLFCYDFTKQMEESLDKIAQGKILWRSICDEYNAQVNMLISDVEEKTDGKKIEFKIDDTHTYTIGRHGPVIRCVEAGVVVFKPVKANIDLRKLELGELALEDVVSVENKNEILIGKYEGVDLYVKSGKFGLYASWTVGKEEKSKSLKCFGNRPMENISLEEVVEVVEKDGNVVRVVSDTVSIRKSKRGDYIFFKTEKMKKPSFFSLKGFEGDYVTCELEALTSWTRERYGVF